MSDTTRVTRDKMKTYLLCQLTLNSSPHSVGSPRVVQPERLDATTDECVNNALFVQ